MTSLRPVEKDGVSRSFVSLWSLVEPGELNPPGAIYTNAYSKVKNLSSHPFQ